IDAAGVEYDSLTWTEPTLEDVYLQLTGETFEGTTTPGASVLTDPDAKADADRTGVGDRPESGTTTSTGGGVE
ncbi:MAG: hypothetical protein ACQETB_12845, partial [Halobacteriota archaeon]